MKSISVITLGITFAVGLLFATSAALLPLYAEAHNGEDHSGGSMSIDVAAVLDSGGTVEQIQSLIAVLQQLIALLSTQVAVSGSTHVDADAHAHEDTDHEETLSISVEVHGGRTHVHVDESGKEEVSFFLDGIDIAEVDAIIAAIAAETGFTTAEVEAAATFPEDDHMEEGDDHADHEEEEEVDLDGLHIMSDGTVMLGSGEELEGATVTDDGMVMLADGDIVEPEYDLR